MVTQQGVFQEAQKAFWFQPVWGPHAWRHLGGGLSFCRRPQRQGSACYAHPHPPTSTRTNQDPAHHCTLVPFFPSFVFLSLFLPSFFFLELHLRYMEVPRLWVELKLQLSAYTTATAMPDLSHLFNLHHSSWRCQILTPLSEARDQTCVLMDASWVVTTEPQQEFHCTLVS